MSDLLTLHISDAVQGLKHGDFSATELAQAYIDEIEKGNEQLNAYVVKSFDQALKMAGQSDERYRNGENRPLDGIPIGVKDLFCTKGLETQACSHILDGFKPAYESTVTEKLWDAGCVMLGKLNMDEFAMGSSNETSYFGTVNNPWRANGSTQNFVPGGSSGGSASAVAAHLCMGATATDTGGSIRQPASFTGTVGLKPTYGRVSRWGTIAFASSLDQAGVISRSVRDSAKLMNVISGYDPKDSTSANIPVPDFVAALRKDIKGMRIGIPKEYRIDGLSDEISELWDKTIGWYKDAGCKIEEVSLPHTKYALPAYYIIAPAEASSNLARYDGVRYGLRVNGDTIDDMYANTRAAGFGQEVKRRILIGTYVLSAGYYDAYYIKAQKVRRLIRRDFDAAFEKVDLLLTPTAPSPAFPMGAKSDPLEMYLNDVFTVTVNMAGLPAISVPAALSKEGLPLGMQLIGKAFDEETVFRGAKVIEDVAGEFLPKTQWWRGGENG